MLHLTLTRLLKCPDFEDREGISVFFHKSASSMVHLKSHES